MQPVSVDPIDNSYRENGSTLSFLSNMLTPDDLRLLNAVRTTGSLSRAARELGKAVSTVSHAARQLEERLDALLFDRRSYRIALTPAGQLLVDEGARL